MLFKMTTHTILAHLQDTQNPHTQSQRFKRAKNADTQPTHPGWQYAVEHKFLFDIKK